MASLDFARDKSRGSTSLDSSRVRRLLLLATPLIAVVVFSGARPASPGQQPISASPLRIVFVGDVLLEAPWQQPPLRPAELFENVRASLSGADVAVCNLEEPLTDWPYRTRHKNPAAVAAGRDFIFRATAPDAATALREAGIDVAALANNHTMDYGERGLLDTIKRLTDAGVLPVGAGETLAEAEQVRVLAVGGLRVGFLSFSDVVPSSYAAEADLPGIASSKDSSRVRAAIARARPSVDFLAVIFHWGEGVTSSTTPRQQELARVAVRAGADLVLGAHPHVLQGVGCVGRVPVVYSAGNFVFSSRRPASQRSALFEIEVVAGRASAIRVVPLLISEQGVPHLAEGTVAENILKEMAGLSTAHGAQASGDTFTCPAPAPGP